ncbi:MAG: rhodanese-like domain-containing protein [Smithellaceae bacterium]|jgi:thiosulfate/3-mercaptopyruvate sulfurtransferase|nr:rhodanese-like domain-containing protein [Smithellaceae bacterium]MDD3258592.1 rhodanese-like domain-containing protein [Smithellaceae bacterium]MDD3849880.1 rhodanese-like domain-containing protein [Smithellaceae bacterium]HOG11557.1 rhodanese-like domain-containing protein [Smithellaceae bacterium]HOQ71561.1 rhodanese-like domain-containing protein [Smithellaceae bacterium]
MKKMMWLKAVVLAVLLLLPLALTAPVQAARSIDPIVSTEWLQNNLNNANLVIVDVRKVEEYKAGHIPGAVNVVYGTWAVKKGDLLNELPAVDDLADAIGSAGIDQNSLVVIVGKTDKVPDQFDMTRVAWTLKYLGVPNVAILSGGQNQWLKESKPVLQDMTRPKEKEFAASVNKGLFVDKASLAGKIGKALVIDTRAPAFYEGKEKLPFVPKLGRIKGAVNLPVGQLYTPEGLYKDKAALAALAQKAAGSDLDKEIIVYCDTGKTCTGWAFIMTDLLGYKDVKVYDGSSMEWLADPNVPTEP